MTTRKVENPNKKGNTAFIWAVLAVLAIALVVIGLIVFNGRENRSAAIKEGMIDVEGINVAWNEDEDIIHLTGSNADAKTAELFEDFSCSHCAVSPASASFWLAISSRRAARRSTEAGSVSSCRASSSMVSRSTERRNWSISSGAESISMLSLIHI